MAFAIGFANSICKFCSQKNRFSKNREIGKKKTEIRLSESGFLALVFRKHSSWLPKTWFLGRRNTVFAIP